MSIILDQIWWDFKASVFNFVWLSYLLCCLADELDFSTELKLSFFQLGISPQILASILMQVLSFFFGQITHFLTRLFCITTLYMVLAFSFSQSNLWIFTYEAVLRGWRMLLSLPRYWTVEILSYPFFSRLHAAVSVNESSLGA